MVKLTIPLESGAENAEAMKQIRNAELVDSGTQDSHQATFTTVEVGWRGFIHLPSLSPNLHNSECHPGYRRIILHLVQMKLERR